MGIPENYKHDDEEDKRWKMSSIGIRQLDDDLSGLQPNRSFFYTFRCPVMAMLPISKTHNK